MERKNKYAHRARLSEAKLRQIVRLFTAGANATLIAEQAGINRNSVNHYLYRMRNMIVRSCEDNEPKLEAYDFDVYFFDLRQYTAPGRKQSADKSFAVCGCAELGRVYTKLFPAETFRPMWEALEGRLALKRADRFSGWSCCEDFGYRKFFGPEPREASARWRRSRLLVDSFWMRVKERIIALRGVPSQTFSLHLKECEFRFNHQREDLVQTLLHMLMHSPWEEVRKR